MIRKKAIFHGELKSCFDALIKFLWDRMISSEKIRNFYFYTLFEMIWHPIYSLKWLDELQHEILVSWSSVSLCKTLWITAQELKQEMPYISKEIPYDFTEISKFYHKSYFQKINSQVKKNLSFVMQSVSNLSKLCLWLKWYWIGSRNVLSKRFYLNNLEILLNRAKIDILP